jgi:hypothetical protein
MSLTKVSYSMIQGEVLNVLDFGAKGDGTTNDTTAIQTALNAGSTVYFPTGTYLISSPLTVNGKQTIFGDSKDLSIIKTNTAINPAIITSSGVVGEVSLRDVQLWNNGGTACINATDSTNGIGGFSQNVKMVGNPCVLGTGAAINPIMNFYYCDFNNYSAASKLIDLRGVNSYNNFTVTNSVFHASPSAIALSITNGSSPSTNAVIQGIFIKNNIFETCDAGAISLGSPFVADISDNYFDDITTATGPLIDIFTISGSNYHPTQVNIANNVAQLLASDVYLKTAGQCIVSCNRFKSLDVTGSNNIAILNNVGSMIVTNSSNTNYFTGGNTVANTIPNASVINTATGFAGALAIGANLSTTSNLFLTQETSSTTQPFVYFQSYIGNLIGSISTNSSSVAYNTTSDRRLKTNIENLTSSGDVIDALQPRTFKWIDSEKADVGFIADELKTVIPGAVHGENDAVDEDGKPIYQMLDVSQPEMIANIIAELQDLRKRVKALESK